MGDRDKDTGKRVKRSENAILPEFEQTQQRSVLTPPTDPLSRRRALDDKRDQFRQATARADAAVTHGKYQGEFITYESDTLFLKRITDSRLQMLRQLTPTDKQANPNTG